MYDFVFVLEVAGGVAGGTLAARWLATIPHKFRVSRCRQWLLKADLTQCLELALNGREEIFSKQNRDWLIELAFCESEERRAELRGRIADDTADRWWKIATDRPSGLRSMMSDGDRAEIEAARHGIEELADTIRLADALKKGQPDC